MIWIIVSTIITLILSFYLGLKRLIYLYQITHRRFFLIVILSLTVYSVLLYLFKLTILSEAVAGAIITNVYASVSGFLLGAASNQYLIKRKAGESLYIHRSFFSEHLPGLISIAMILWGFYRSDLFTADPVTPIRITSGLSVASLGIWGLTLRLVPEFRKNGIVILDFYFKWDDFITYSWYTEEILEIEYLHSGTLKSFKTLIPDDDQIILEQLLSKKMSEKLEDEIVSDTD
jgi:hypothetical protein